MVFIRAATASPTLTRFISANAMRLLVVCRVVAAAERARGVQTWADAIGEHMNLGVAAPARLVDVREDPACRHRDAVALPIFKVNAERSRAPPRRLSA